MGYGNSGSLSHYGTGSGSFEGGYNAASTGSYSKSFPGFSNDNVYTPNYTPGLHQGNSSSDNYDDMPPPPKGRIKASSSIGTRQMNEYVNNIPPEPRSLYSQTSLIATQPDYIKLPSSGVNDLTVGYLEDDNFLISGGGGDSQHRGFRKGLLSDDALAVDHATAAPPFLTQPFTAPGQLFAQNSLMMPPSLGVETSIGIINNVNSVDLGMGVTRDIFGGAAAQREQSLGGELFSRALSGNDLVPPPTRDNDDDDDDDDDSIEDNTGSQINNGVYDGGEFRRMMSAE
jgi:hypothetical protein